MAGDTILRRATMAELGRAVEENLFALFRAMTTLPGGELTGGDVGRHFTFPTNPMFKGAWRTRFLDAEAERRIDETIAWFRERKAPYFFWWTGPDTTPSDLGKRLEARGLLSMEAQSRELAHGIVQTAAGAPCMATDLTEVDDSLVTKTPADFVIEEIADDDSLEAFKRVFVATYEIPEWAGQAWVDATRTIGIGRTPWRMFLGRLGGEPVATNMLFIGGGVASVYAVATVATARNKGIGAAITLKPLLIARGLGYRYAVLFATEAGRSVYRRLGFRDCGVTINRYFWRDS
jgi:hypothetical protein